jgi:hypothetical protein
MMNLDKMRQDGLTLADYQYLVDRLRQTFGTEKKEIYFGDQGLLSAAFVGDVCCYGFPQIRDIWYMPYNFCLWYFDLVHEKPNYRPAILHFAGTAFKPWNGTYPIFVKRFEQSERRHPLSELKVGQAEYFYLWHEYAIVTDHMLKNLGFQ